MCASVQCKRDNKQTVDLRPVLGSVTTPDDLRKYIVTDQTGLSTCAICHNFSHRSKYDCQNHIESRHFPNSFLYNCQKCHKTVSTRKALVRHTAGCGKL